MSCILNVSQRPMCQSLGLLYGGIRRCCGSLRRGDLMVILRSWKDCFQRELWGSGPFLSPLAAWVMDEASDFALEHTLVMLYCLATGPKQWG